jgi:hypothetical protein
MVLTIKTVCIIDNISGSDDDSDSHPTTEAPSLATARAHCKASPARYLSRNPRAPLSQLASPTPNRQLNSSQKRCFHFHLPSPIAGPPIPPTLPTTLPPPSPAYIPERDP